MGLDLLPRRTTHHETTDKLPRGITRPAGASCPFTFDDFPIGPMGTCCSLRGKAAADNLGALGELQLNAAMHLDMDADEARRFATRLRATADRLEQRYAGQKDKPKGASSGGMINAETGEITPWPRPSFEEALTSIRKAADWYEKVARLGFGVHAWY